MLAECGRHERALVILERTYQRGHAIACTCDAAESLAASATAVTVQRRIIRPPRQRFTRRVRRRTDPIRFSIAFVVESWRSSFEGRSSRFTVRVSSSPLRAMLQHRDARRGADARGWRATSSRGSRPWTRTRRATPDAPTGACPWGAGRGSCVPCAPGSAGSGHAAEHVADRLSQCLRAVDHGEHAAVGVHATIAQVGE